MAFSVPYPCRQHAFPELSREAGTRDLRRKKTEEMDATAERTAPAGSPEPGSTGDPGGLSALYVRCMPEAVGLAYLLTGDEELARDIADEAFVRGAGRFEHRLGRVRFP